MTSGNFRTFPVSRIWVDRAKRQRRDLPDIEGLAASIRERGLIHPPVVADTGELIAGERRWEAIKLLGWDQTHVQLVTDLDEWELQAIELEENIKRVDISWQDRIRAVERWHSLRKSNAPDWNLDKTADELGLGRDTVKDYLAVAREMKTNTLVSEAPKYSVAKNIKKRNEARRVTAAETQFSQTLSEPVDVGPIQIADFNEWALSYTGPKFNFLHCDFPYGINASEFNQGSAAKHGGYVDSPDTYFQLLRTLAAGTDRLLDASAHVIFWFSMKFYHETLEFFRNETDFDVSPYPLVWLKNDNAGILPRPNHGPRQIYETAFFGFRGDRPVVRAKSNAFASPSVRDDHMSIKPEPVLRHFFEMVVDQNTSMLDPTCGSGSALRVAHSLNAARVVGLERDAEFADRANLAWLKMVKENKA